MARRPSLIAACLLLVLCFPAVSKGAEPVPAAASEAFAVDLLESGPSGNAVYSPDSIATALAMAGTGAAGPTAGQIADTLRLPGPKWLDSVGGLQGTIAAGQASAGEGNPAAPTLKFANGLFAQVGLPLRPGYVERLQRHFASSVNPVDFAVDPLGALATINSWTSEHTEGLIPELFTEPLSPQARLVLADAAYLKATWRHRFKHSATYKEAFHRPNGKVRTDFMHQERSFPYGSGPGYQAVELPYAASTLSLLVVLPVGSEAGELQRRLEGNGVATVVKGLRRRPVELSLPLFHLNRRTNLVEPLKALGMKLPFTEAANFSRIAAGVPLQIGAVEHVADLAVDEEGTVAAAATGVAVTVTSASPPLRGAVSFDADRPFLFFLRDDSTGAVLFAGRVVDPTGA
jgi:serpin B